MCSSMAQRGPNPAPNGFPFEPVKSALNQSTQPVKSARCKFAPTKDASVSFAPRNEAAISVAPEKSAMLRMVSEKSAPVALTSCSCPSASIVCLNDAPCSCERMKRAWSRLAPSKTLPCMNESCSHASMRASLAKFVRSKWPYWKRTSSIAAAVRSVPMKEAFGMMQSVTEAPPNFAPSKMTFSASKSIVSLAPCRSTPEKSALEIIAPVKSARASMLSRKLDDLKLANCSTAPCIWA
mmetsp:Transcript_7333/g.16199  ORF Transcript_7333/g.16199 Transcript_7333/m.16199 type:complete len:238 (+) Transcript_7333:407-1120(+)